MIESDHPWYSDGLRFTCTRCGNCCTGQPGAVWIDDTDIERIAEHTGKTIGEVRLFHTRLHGGRLTLREFANGDCTFLDPQTRECQVYPVRPLQCRTWPFWTSNLGSREKWEAVQAICPGAGCGKLHRLEEIESQTGAEKIS